MQQKLKFKPVITRVKLNPEQAVLSCGCYNSGIRVSVTGTRSATSTGKKLCGSGSHGLTRSWPTKYSSTAINAAVS